MFQFNNFFGHQQSNDNQTGHLNDTAAANCGTNSEIMQKMSQTTYIQKY